ncbi:MAG: anhydro-N-acetylmuramic acid kinase [Archangiaceae bacterium]|nr:anhydro-N-acetylmuramic acid kinase [Archangiaceae bacterium]
MPLPARLERAAQKKERIVVGLISGTSVDAVEAVVCGISGTADTTELELLSHVSVPFPPAVVKRVLELTTVRELCALNFELGERFGRAALKAVKVAGLQPEDVDLVGSHGQTVAHLPGSTLQIGEASVIAELIGAPVVCDFRTRDVAAGGQGAPLVPYADWVLFRRAGTTRALQNIGGIANVSVVGDRLEDTIAFDTGPGNMLLDAIARLTTRNRKSFDENAELAFRGEVMPKVLAELLKHPFLKQRPPRSAGRDQFGEALSQSLWKRFKKRPHDLLATLSAFTIEATVRAYEKFVLPERQLEAVYLSGGGSRNPFLTTGLERRLAPIPVRPLDALGFPEGAKEAACFALLASEWLSGTAQNVPAATGARARVILGKLVP